jgi:uncharacterized membrane protein YccC
VNVWSFLATELAPTPGRFRATMRVVVACVVAIVVVMELHVPYGHWAVITIFTVSQTDASSAGSRRCSPSSRSATSRG